MTKRASKSKTVVWLSDEIPNKKCFTTSFKHFEKFQFKDLIGEIGDYVLISNADAAEPDTEEGCDAAKIILLYEDMSNKTDPYRAKVQWYSKPSDLPNGCLNKLDPIYFFDKEVIEDHRPFDTDVSIETFYKKCYITHSHTKESDNIIKGTALYNYICRYRLIAAGRRKVNLEPVLEEERNALQFFSTPKKSSLSTTPKTPNNLIKRMSRVSLSETNSWNVTKNDGTKLLLKRAILCDKNDKQTPIKATPKKTPKEEPMLTETPKSSKKISKQSVEEIISMELKENSDEELPTLIIRQYVPSTPKRQSRSSNSMQTPKKELHFQEEEKVTYSTRFGRKTKHPTNYIAEDISPVKRTPKKNIKRYTSDSDDDFKPLPKTPTVSRIPRTPRTPKTPRTYVTKTPRRSATKRILMSELTPTLHSRAHYLDNIQEFLKENRSLPEREKQMEEILSFVRNKLLGNTSGCMYISGVPGTGKTATVNAALKALKEESDLPDFQLIEVNGMRIAEPRQAYVQIYKQLTGKTVVWEQACSLLEKRFTQPGPRRTPTVLVVDELDALSTRRQDVLYSIMEWASHDTALLTVLAVANTMDLPERALASRVASRLGLTRLTFKPYTHIQLQSIVASRLAGANVTADALQLISRKVSAVSGDARRALALCTRALELAGTRTAGTKEVGQALNEAASSAVVRAIKSCAPAERLMLRAVAAEVERTGSDETTLSRALVTAADIVAIDGRPYKSAPSIRPPTASQAQAICARLASMKLLLMEPKPAEPRLLLNVSADDVHYATKDITV